MKDLFENIRCKGQLRNGKKTQRVEKCNLEPKMALPNSTTFVVFKIFIIYLQFLKFILFLKETNLENLRRFSDIGGVVEQNGAQHKYDKTFVIVINKIAENDTIKHLLKVWDVSYNYWETKEEVFNI